MELMKDLITVTGRIFTIIPLLLIVTLYMGKRAIGELPVFDFLVIINKTLPLSQTNQRLGIVL